VSLREYSVSRLNSVLEEIGRLKESEFPYPHSRDALVRIEQLFLAHKAKLEGLSADKKPAIVQMFCATALTDLFKYLAFLGFILRSTNVRNAFEVYGPLLRLSQQILGKNTKLILSSEWEEYSPFTYRPISELPNFVFIGFPAPESSNPLLIPLAGHELGHTIWNVKLFAAKYAEKIEERIIAEIRNRFDKYTEFYSAHASKKEDIIPENLFVKRAIALPTEWAIKQCEEFFCDFVGLYLFDVSYLHAFAYLFAPTAGQRSILYPNTLTRVEKLKEAAARFSVDAEGAYKVPDNYAALFRNKTELPPNEEQKKFLLSLADAASNGLADDLINEAKSVLSAANVPLLSSDEKKRILECYKFVVPAVRVPSLSTILNAAWDVYHDRNFWEHMPQIESRRRALKEVVLKNIEVLEIEQILEDKT
jgi:hypothetical protein